MQLELAYQEDWPPVEIPDTSTFLTDDGIPLYSPWHRDEISLLIDSLSYIWRGRNDYYVGGNMFIYYCLEQARTLNYRGPDFFVVKNVDGKMDRDCWIIWDEGGRYPNVIIELLSFPQHGRVGQDHQETPLRTNIPHPRILWL